MRRLFNKYAMPDPLDDGYRELAPHPALRGHIECFWLAAGSSDARRILPDGCIDFLFDAGSGGAGSRLIGAMRSAQQVPATARRDVVAVRFHPGGARAWVDAPLDEFTDTEVELGSLGGSFRELAHVGADGAPVTERVHAIEAWLLRHWRGRGDGIDACLSAMRTGNGFRVDAAAAALAISRQHFTRAVRARTGLSPKLLARILRMRRALTDHRRMPPAALALQHGYADQSHLARDVREIAGCTLPKLA